MPDQFHFPPKVPHTTWYVSPDGHTQHDLYTGDFATRVAIIESQFRNWFFDQASLLWSEANPKRDHSGLAVLALMTPSFEAIEEFRSGKDSKGQSKAFFNRGFRAVFALLVANVQTQTQDAAVDAIADAVYAEIRCGLFHNATTRRRVQFAWGMKTALSVQYLGEDDAHRVEIIVVSPAAYAVSIQNDFVDYLDELTAAPADSPLRLHFEEAFARRMGLTSSS